MNQQSKTNFLPWLLIILVFLVILGVAYWYYIKYVQPTEITTLNPSPASPTTIPTTASISLTPSSIISPSPSATAVILTPLISSSPEQAR